MSQGKNIKYKTGHVDKYLTDIKELPPSENLEPVLKKSDELKPKTEIKEMKVKEQFNVEKDREKDLAVQEEEIQRPLSIFSIKDIILGLINFVSIVLLTILLTKLPIKAQEFQNERIEEIKNQVNPESEFADLKEDKEKADRLEKLFLDESGVVNFVSNVEKLKSQNEAIKRVIFASQRSVKDSSGLFGIPIIIEIKGSWQAIGAALEQIQGLPFLFRPVSVEAGPSKEDPSVVTFNYGGFLYVDDKKIVQ